MSRTRSVRELSVRAGLAFVGLVLVAGGLQAQQPPEEKASRPFEITDNSFLVEEAFNQEDAVFQNIFALTRSPESSWAGSFTQEWPVRSQRHQLSYTVPFAAIEGHGGVSDVIVNYRYQLFREGERLPAFSPRASVVLPSGTGRGFGAGVVGWQVNLPFSKQYGDTYVHWNAGLTYLPGVRNISRLGGDGAQMRTNLLSPSLGASAIWRIRPMLNLMLETLGEFVESAEPTGGSIRERALTLSPGFRGGWNVGHRQVIVGLALPVRISGSDRDVSALTYFSYELPFRSVQPEP